MFLIKKEKEDSITESLILNFWLVLHLWSLGLLLSYPGNESMIYLLTILLMNVDSVNNFCRQLQHLAFQKEK